MSGTPPASPKRKRGGKNTDRGLAMATSMVWMVVVAMAFLAGFRWGWVARGETVESDRRNRPDLKGWSEGFLRGKRV